ncbi:MAG TPA: hypothetical protein VFV78_03375 [Vicinamibacterales bacterium]|nr:hypothetical protein [Vicinamibacterales bacterium]
MIRTNRALILIPLLAFAWSGCGSRELTIVDRLRDQVERYPAMQTEDVYKFVHQAAFGNGHLMTDEAADRGYLTQELATAGADSREPLLEAITPDGSVVRVNLRPFKAAGFSVDELADAMIASSRAIQPNRDAFERWWTEVADAAAHHKLPFDAEMLRAFGSVKKGEGYPAVHHSPEYASRYLPSYRVVLRDLVPKLR